MIRYKSRNGYVLLLTVLVVGVVASASAIAILLLGLGIERNAFAIQLSSQSYASAWSCIEEAISRLQNDLEYQGNDVIEILYGYDENGALGYGTNNCTLYPIGGWGNYNRTICAHGTFGNFTRRRIEIEIERVLPTTSINSWEEVSRITLCDQYTPPQCGDNIIQASTNEECDDGNTADGDGCSSNCLAEACGDDEIQGTEECDDGAESASCNSDCTTASCGDSKINATRGESCDDGNGVGNDGCSPSCIIEYCGDSVANNGEDCDSGAVNSSACDANCTSAVCGDGYTNSSTATPAGGEQCDDSGESASCNSDCTSSVCGDSKLNVTDGETCDAGSETAGCDDDCTAVACGDGNLNETAGEQCDDGNTTPGDGCDASCNTEACGDTIIDIGEDCDDGGESATCDSDCTTAECGDGNVNGSMTTPVGGETCDAGGESVSCDNDCTAASCGDGTVNITAGEDCDDAGESASCNTDCSTSVCGDGTLNVTDNEECDDGNVTDNDGCSSSCQTEDAPLDYIAYWKLDETTGSSVADSSGNGYTCTKNGGASTSADVPIAITFSDPQSRDFDGSNDYLSCGSSADLAPSNISISFWSKNDVTPSQYDGLICKTNSTTWTNGWGFYYNSSSQIRFFIQSFTSNAAYASISPTQWNHIVGTWDGTTMRIYVNGVEGTSDSYSGAMNTSQALGIGRCGHNSLNIDGKIDDVRIYDRALSQAEVTALSNGQ